MPAYLSKGRVRFGQTHVGFKRVWDSWASKGVLSAMAQPKETAEAVTAYSKPIVLITGASGFIGGAIIKRLSEHYTLVGLDRAGVPDPPAPAHAVVFDVSSDTKVVEALDEVRRRFGTRLASVIHLAAYYDVSGEPNPLYDEITVQGTRRLIDVLKTFEVEQFVYASTMLVHKPTAQPDETIDEDSPIEPSWAYPESKVRAEVVLREHHGKIPVVFLRIAGVYDDDGHSPFLAEQIARIYEHRLTSHFYPGMLCAAQSFVHLDDLTDAVAKVVEKRRELPSELPLLVGEPDPLGYAEIQDIVGQALHDDDWATLRIPMSFAKLGVAIQNDVLGDEPFIKPWMVDSSNDHYILDISRAQSLLGWEPKHHLRDTLPVMVAALKRDPQAWYKANKLNTALVAWYKKDAPEPASGKDHAGHGNGRAAETAPAKHAAMDAMPMDHTSHAMAGPLDGKMPDTQADHSGHMATMERDERRARWAHYANIGLGLWLASSPLMYDAVTTQSVGEAVRAVTIDRDLPSV
ncbi:MAG: NAD(P)-dependent oxidoreductase, partial [Sphingomicrobium sp.]